MASRLELPDGDVVDPGEIVLFEGYPYRYRPAPEDAAVAFVLSPVYWGDSPLDVPFQSAADLESRWGAESRGRLSADEWEAWIADARESPTFADAEIDAIEDAVLPDRRRRLLERVRSLLSLGFP